MKKKDQKSESGTEDLLAKQAKEITQLQKLVTQLKADAAKKDRKMASMRSAILRLELQMQQILHTINKR